MKSKTYFKHVNIKTASQRSATIPLSERENVLVIAMTISA